MSTKDSLLSLRCSCFHAGVFHMIYGVFGVGGRESLCSVGRGGFVFTDGVLACTRLDILFSPWLFLLFSAFLSYFVCLLLSFNFLFSLLGSKLGVATKGGGNAERPPKS